MMALLKGETGHQVVTQALANNPGECFAHVFNLAEVYYLFFRLGGSSAAELATQTLLGAGIIPREDADTDFWKEAASFKGRHPMALPCATGLLPDPLYQVREGSMRHGGKTGPDVRKGRT